MKLVCSSAAAAIHWPTFPKGLWLQNVKFKHWALINIHWPRSHLQAFFVDVAMRRNGLEREDWPCQVCDAMEDCWTLLEMPVTCVLSWEMLTVLVLSDNWWVSEPHMWWHDLCSADQCAPILTSSDQCHPWPPPSAPVISDHAGHTHINTITGLDKFRINAQLLLNSKFEHPRTISTISLGFLMSIFHVCQKKVFNFCVVSLL